MERRKSYVYKIMCKITGEYYFGSSFYANRDCYWGSGRRIRERIYQYGKENFVKEILGEFDDRVEAHKKENEYIEKFRHDEKCLNQMLNCHFGAFSEKTRKKHSDAMCGEKNHNFGKIFSEETRAKLSAAHLGKHLSDDTRAKIGVASAIAKRGEKNPMFGKHHTEETKQKIRESLIGKTPGNKGKKLNKETGKYE